MILLMMEGICVGTFLKAGGIYEKGREIAAFLACSLSRIQNLHLELHLYTNRLHT